MEYRKRNVTVMASDLIKIYGRPDYMLNVGKWFSFASVQTHATRSFKCFCLLMLIFVNGLHKLAMTTWH